MYRFTTDDGETGKGVTAWKAILQCMGRSAYKLPQLAKLRWTPSVDAAVIRRSDVYINADGRFVGVIEELK